MRAVIAFVATGLIAAIAFWWATSTSAALDRTTRQRLREACERGELPGVDWQTANPRDFGAEIPASMMWRVQVADLLMGFWYVWLPLLGAVMYFAVRVLPLPVSRTSAGAEVP